LCRVPSDFGPPRGPEVTTIQCTKPENRVKGLRVRYKGIRGSAQAAIAIQDFPPALRLELLDLRLGATAIPKWLWGRWSVYALPLTPTPDLPFNIELPSLTIRDSRVLVP
jgi:hypothetical protein